MMYKHILVAVDGSKTAKLALKEAIKLAKEQKAQLRIVHVVDVVTFYWDWPLFVEVNRIQEAVRSSGKKVLDKAEDVARAAGVKVKAKLLEIRTMGYRISSMIVDEAKAWPADLIVIGTHGRRGLSHLFLGSVAEGVVRLATKPVLLIRGQEKDRR